MEDEGNGSICPIRTQTERRKTMIVLQLLLYCLLFTAMVKIAVIGGAVNGLYFYRVEQNASFAKSSHNI